MDLYEDSPSPAQGFGPDSICRTRSADHAGPARLDQESVGSTNDLNPIRRSRVSFILLASCPPNPKR